MNRTKEEYHNLLNETIQYYSEDINRRALDKNNLCCYYTTDGKMCAVGRCLEHPESFEKTDIDIDLAIHDLTITKQDFKEKYRGFAVNFWFDLQYLHDNNNFWEKDGLTQEGKEYVDYMIKKIDGKRGIKSYSQEDEII